MLVLYILIVVYVLCIGNAIPTVSDSNSLFLAVSYCMHTTKDKHSEIILWTINKIINDWDHYKGFILDLSVVNGPKITKIYSPEMWNTVNKSNWQASAVYFLIICTSFITKSAQYCLLLYCKHYLSSVSFR